ncbi:MAG: TIGR02757 family protein [Synergistaceae bacterium]
MKKGVLSTESALLESREIFENIYRDYNKRVYVSPDPLQFLYEYDNPLDREIVAIIASSLAYGRVAQILKSVKKVLDVLGSSPSDYLKNATINDFENNLRGFTHRFTDDKEIVAFLTCISGVLKRGSTLEDLFCSHYDGDIKGATELFVSDFFACGEKDKMYLLPSPANGSACKRLALFLRWMVREDDVDPGGWKSISPASLVIPLDTHMFNICSTLGLCSRKSADAKSVEEITQAFRIISPNDPVRYDFALTRFGIRSEMTVEALFEKWDYKF